MASTQWNIDPSHTLVEFAVRHMMIATVKGTFSGISGSVTGNPEDLTTGKVSVSIDLDTIETRDAQRDEHLKSADFFDTDNFPKMTFESRSITRTGDNTYNIDGDLTVRDNSRPITLEAEFTGQGQDPWGNTRAGFDAKTKLSRKDFGLTWNQALETGGVLVGDEVRITISAELVQQQEEQA